MKSSFFILLCVIFCWDTSLNVRAQNQVPDAQSWEDLKRAESTTITSVADNCCKAITEARQKCKDTISQSQQNQAGAVEEVSQTLLSLIHNIREQFLEIGNRFQKRLQSAVNNSKMQQNIKDELNAILQNEPNESTQLTITIKKFFTNNYNPASQLSKHIRGPGNEKLLTVLEEEIQNVEKVLIQILNTMNKGITMAKDIQLSLRNTGTLPKQWSEDYIKQILISCVHITSALQNTAKSTSLSQPSAQNTPSQSLQKRSRDLDVSDSSEEVETAQDEQESVGNIFENTKKKILKDLVFAIKDIRDSAEVLSMDAETYEALQDYQKNFQSLSHKVSAKIIDFIHQFIKLYNVILDIMDKINPDMKQKMEEIFNDHKTVDTGDMHYLNIMKYLSQEYMTDKKLNELHSIIMNNLKNTEDQKSVQNQIIKQLSLLTNGVIRDVDSMKSTVVYILLEMKKGVVALQNLKNKSNITGIRYLFNYYKGTSDLAQLQKLIYIINALNIEGLLNQEIKSVVSKDKLSIYENLSKTLQKKLLQESTIRVKQLEQTSLSIREVQRTTYTFISNYNSMLKTYTIKTRKVIKHIVMKFIRIYEEVLIIIKRRKVNNVQVLDDIIDNAVDIGSDVPLITKYLSQDNMIDVERISGIHFNKRIKDVSKAKDAYKQTMLRLKQYMSTEISELHKEINHIVKMIIQETQKLHQLKGEVQTTQDYSISIEKFEGLERIMKLANTLQISHGDITNGLSTESDSSNKELEKYFANAKKRLRMEQSTAEQLIEKSNTLEQIQTETQKTITKIQEIVSETGMEMRSDIHQSITQYNEALNALTRSNEDIRKQIENTNCDSITLSQHFTDYVQDKYSMSILELFKKSVIEIQDIQQSKQITIESLKRTVKNIEDGMEAAKAEALKSIFNHLKHATDTLENLGETELSTLGQEQLNQIASAYSLIKTLNEMINVDTRSSSEEAYAAIETAQLAMSEEYKKAVEAISIITKEAEFDTQMSFSVQKFNSIYNTMRQGVKTRFEQVSSDFYENYKKLSTSIKEKNSEIYAVMHEISSENYSSSLESDNQYEKFLSTVHSESYKSASAVTIMYEQIQETEHHISSDQCLLEIESLNSKIMESIDNIKEITNFIYESYEQSSSIMKSIQEESLGELSENEISILTKSLTLSQKIIQIQQTVDFTSAQHIINENLKNALEVISVTTGENIIQETIDKSIIRYDSISATLKEEIMQKFIKTSSDFTSSYETAMQAVKLKKNSELENTLQQILENKNSNSVSQKYEAFEKYFNSDRFSCTGWAKNIYQQLSNQPENTNIKETSKEQLKEIVTKITENIIEMDTQSTYLRQNFLKGNKILQSIKNGQTKLNEEEINILTECSLLSQSIFHQDSHNVRSMDIETASVFSKAKSAINEEYQHIIETIKTTTNQQKIKEAISSGVSKYDTIFNTMREEVRENVDKNLNEFTATYETVINDLESSNSEIRTEIQNVFNGRTSIKLSEKYMKIDSFIHSSEFTSSTVVQDMYTKMQKDSSFIEDIQERDLKKLDILTNDIKDCIADTSGIQQMVTEVLKQGMEILLGTQTKTETTLSEEQIITLQESFRISQLLSKYKNSNQQIEKAFKLAQGNIEEEGKKVINIIKTATNEEQVKSVETSTIEKYNSIYNTLEEEIQKIFKQQSSEFTETFNNLLQSTSIQQNTELYNSLQNIRNEKIEMQYSEEYKRFESYLFSEVFSSKRGIVQAYQNINAQQQQQFQSSNDECIANLNTLTTEVINSIIEMNTISQYVQRNFQKSQEILKNIENNHQQVLNQDQIHTLLENINISEMITFTCNSFSQAEKEVINQAEVNITIEYGKSITSIKAATSDTQVEEVVQDTVQKYETICASLQNNVEKYFTEWSQKLSTTYKTIDEKLKTQETSSIQIILQDIQNSQTEVHYSEAYKYFQAYLNITSSSTMISKWYLDLKVNSNTSVKENSLKEIKLLTSKVTHYITETNNIFKYVNQMIRKCEEIFNCIESSSTEHLTQEQMTTLSEGLRISNMISNSMHQQTLELEYLTQAQKSITHDYKNALQGLQNAHSEEESEKIMFSTVKSYDSTYNDLQKQIKKVFQEENSKFKEKFLAMMEIKSIAITSSLADIKHHKISLEQCLELETYLQSKCFTSSSFITSYYFNIENEENSGPNQKRSINELEICTEELRKQIQSMRTMQEYISRTYTETTKLFSKIERNELQQLSEEQIITISRAQRISEILDITFDSKLQSEETLFHSVESTITQTFENTLINIQSATNEESINKILSNSIQEYKSSYINLQQEVKNSYSQYSTEVKNIYKSVIQRIASSQNIEVQKALESVSMDTTLKNCKKYQKFEELIKSRSNTEFVQTEFNEFIDENFDTKTLLEHSIRKLRKSTSKYSQKVIEMGVMKQMVSLTLQKSISILKKIESDTIIKTLSQEEIETLQECFTIIKIIDTECSSRIRSEEKIFDSCEQNVDKEYKNTVNTIQSATNREDIDKAIKTSAQNYESNFKNLKKQVTETMTKNTEEFINLYSTVFNKVISEENQNLKSVFQDIQKTKISYQTEEYKNFEFYIKMQDTFSWEFINKGQNMNTTTANIHQYGMETLNTLTKHELGRISEIYTINKYISQNTEKGTNILKSLQDNSQLELTKEEMIILTESLKLSEKIAIVYNTKNLKEEDLFKNAKSNIETEYETAKHTLQSTTNYESAKEVLKSSAQNYDQTFNSLKEEMKQSMTQSSSEFFSTFESTYKSVESHSNTNIQDKLKNIKEMNLENQISKEYKKFESFLQSESFTSTTLIENIYKNLEKESKNIKDNIHQLETLTSEVNKNIAETNDIRRYITQTFQESTVILKSIENYNVVEVNEEQIKVLNECMLISKNLQNLNNHSTRSLDTSNKESEIITKSKLDINIEMKNAIETIKVASNEETAKETVKISIDRYNSIYNNMCKNIQGNIKQAEENYSYKLKELQQNTKSSDSKTARTLTEITNSEEDKILMENNEEYHTFSKYLEKGTFETSNRVKSIYEDLYKSTITKSTQTQNDSKLEALRRHISDKVSSQSSTYETEIQQITTITEKVTTEIEEMNFIEKFTMKSYQKSNEIIETLSQNGEIELSNDQIDILKVTAAITRKLSQKSLQSSKTEDHIQKVNVEEAQNKITQECENTINSIQSMTNEEEIQQVVSKSIEEYNQVFTEVRESTKIQVTQESEDFTRSVQQIKQSKSEEKSTYLTIVFEEVEKKREIITSEEEYLNFATLIESEEFNSDNAVKSIHQNVQQSHVQQNENVNEQVIQELKQLSTEVNHKLTEIDKTSKYVHENINEGNQIIQKLQQNEEIQLEEKEIIILTKCVQISEVVHEKVKVDQTSMYSSSSNTESKLDIAQYETKIQENYDTTVSTIETAENEEKVAQAVEASVKNYNGIRNQAKEEIETKINEKTSKFEESLKSSNNTEINQVIEDVKNDKISCKSNERLKKLEAYIKSDRFKSASAIKNKFQKLREQGNESTDNNNNNNYGVKDLETVKSTTEEDIKEMEEMKDYVTRNLQKGENILKTAQNKENINLTEEEKEVLAEDYKITQILSQNNEMENQKSFVNTKTNEINFEEARNTITRNCNKAVDQIKLKTDEKEITQIVEDQVHTYNTIYKDIEEFSHYQVYNRSEKFMNAFKDTANNAPNQEVQQKLSDIVRGQTYQSEELNKEVDSEFKEFEEFVYRKAPRMNCLNQMDNTLAEITKEEKIQKMENLGRSINENINFIEKNTKYVEEIFDESNMILEKAHSEQVQFSEEEMKQISKSLKIVEVLSKGKQTNENSINFSPSTNTRSLGTEVTTNHVTEETSYDYRTEVQKSQKTIIIEEEAEEESTYSKGKCVSIQPQLLITDNKKSIDMVSFEKLLVNWKVHQSDHSTPAVCQNLSWKNEKFLQINTKIVVSEVVEVLKITRQLINSVIQVQLETVKLARQIHELLSSTTICTENIDRILQKVSNIITEELKRKENNLIVNQSNRLDAEFLTVYEEFSSLKYSKKTNLLAIIDQEYQTEVCDNFKHTKEITLEKFKKVKSVTDMILNNIDCLMLVLLDSSIQ